MSPKTIALVLLSAAIHVGWNLLTKSSANPKTFTLLVGMVTIAIFTVTTPFIPFASIPPDVWIYLALSGAIHALYFTALSNAYETGDISFVYPIERSSTAFVPVAAFFVLGEKLSLRGISGIAIVIMCIFLIQVRGKAEIRALWRSIKRKDSIWAFVTLGTVVSYTMVDKAGMVAFSQVNAIASEVRGPIYFLIDMAFCFLIYWACVWRSIKPTFTHALKHEWPRAVAAATGVMASYSLILHVMQTDIVSYIVTLRQSGVLIAVLIGSFVLKEPFGRLRLVIAAIMLCGFFLVATAR
jgi:drug/metabolite transporter (DMT)-like permease